MEFTYNISKPVLLEMWKSELQSQLCFGNKVFSKMTWCDVTGPSASKLKVRLTFKRYFLSSYRLSMLNLKSQFILGIEYL